MKSMSVEEKAFMVLAASEEAQERVEVILGKLETLAKTLPGACESQIKNTTMFYIDLHMKESLGGVKDAFRNVETASGRLKEELTESTLWAKKNRNILRFQGFWQIMQMTIAVILILGVVFAISDITLKNRFATLQELRGQIAIEQKTLKQLKSETWGLTLTTFEDGSRGIILPKGVAIDRTGALMDKSGRIGIVIKP